MSANAKTLTLTKTYPVSVDKLFKAWVDSSVVKSWMAPGAMRVGTVDINPVADGVYAVEMKDVSGEAAQMNGKVQAVEDNLRLVLQWQWAHSGHATEVEVNFRSLPDNVSEMHLVHRGFESMDEMQNHQNGWKGCCEKLAKVFA